MVLYYHIWAYQSFTDVWNTLQLGPVICKHLETQMYYHWSWSLALYIFMHLADALNDLLHSYFIGSCTPWEFNSRLYCLACRNTVYERSNVQSIFDASRRRSIASPCFVLSVHKHAHLVHWQTEVPLSLTAVRMYNTYCLFIFEWIL